MSERTYAFIMFTIIGSAYAYIAYKNDAIEFLVNFWSTM